MSIHFQVKTPDGLLGCGAEPFRYPAGEWHLKNVISNDLTPDGSVYIADVRGAQPEYLLLAGAFAQVAHARQHPFVLMLPYLPAARSDKMYNTDEPVGAQVYSDFVRSMNPQQIIGIDPHSTVIEQLMAPKLTVLSHQPLLEIALRTVDPYDGIIAPDKGAVGRAQVTADVLGLDLYTAEKHRIQETGVITGIKMTEPLPPSGRYLVVDDICDGGGTFMGLAEVTGLDRDHIDLWTTHFTGNPKAIQLREAYGQILTSDSHPGHNAFGDYFNVEENVTKHVHIIDMMVPCGPYMLQKVWSHD